MAGRKLIVEIIGDSSSLEKALGRAQRSSSGFGSSLRSVGRTAAFAASGVAVGGLVLALKRGYDEFSDTAKVAAQTAAGIKSTGGAARVTAKHVDRLAASVSKYSGIDDEAVQAGENILLTFTNIRNEVGKNNKIFDEATKAVADLATRMNNGAIPSAEQLSKTSIQVGKALQDPIRGLGALRRVGVDFTEAQKELVKKLVETGRVEDAQRLILRELNKEFGGSARAAGSTLPGALAKLRNATDEITGALVALGVRALQPYLERAARWLQNSRNQQLVIDKVTGAVRTVSGVIRDLIPIVKTAAEVADRVAKAFGGWNNALKIFVGLAIASKVAKITGSLTGSGGLLPALKLVSRNWKINLTILGAAAIGLALAKLQKKLDELTGATTRFKGAGGKNAIRNLGRGVGFDPRTGTLLNIGKGSSPDLAPVISQKAAAKSLGISIEELKKRLALIPRFALGGIVKTPTLAMVGERGPEAIVPLSKLHGSTININGDLHLPGVSDARSFLRELQREAERRGGSRRGPYPGSRLALT